jgi:hypothetical protein
MPKPPSNNQNRPPNRDRGDQRTLKTASKAVIGANSIRSFNPGNITSTTQKTPTNGPGNGLAGGILGSAIYDLFKTIFRRVSPENSMEKSSNATQNRPENGSDVVKLSIYLLIIVCLRIYCHFLDENIL